MQLTPENETVTREDIIGYLSDGMGEDEIRWTLAQRKTSPEDIDKIIDSLSSYN